MNERPFKATENEGSDSLDTDWLGGNLATLPDECVVTIDCKITPGSAEIGRLGIRRKFVLRVICRPLIKSGQSQQATIWITSRRHAGGTLVDTP
jgi:hypothetical protein